MKIEKLAITAILGLFTASSLARADNSLTVLHSFTSEDNNGVFPKAGLLFATNGSFYGTTSGVRMNGSGRRIRPTIFRITPNGTFLTVAYFDRTNIDGTKPGPWQSDELLSSDLIQGKDGNLYGAAVLGGMNGYGQVFKMTLDGKVTTLHSFEGYSGTNGWGPQSGVIEGQDGWFYGTAYNGGVKMRTDNVGMGTVYKVRTDGTLKTLFHFMGTNGEFPASGLIVGKDGNYYGTTAYGGPSYAKGPPEHGFGTVFQLTTNGGFTTLFSFDGTNGSQPFAGLARGSDGAFYGTTKFGGLGYGTIFRVTPTGDFTSLFSFDGTNGARPGCALVKATDGSLYGTTEFGGENYKGPQAGIEHLFYKTFGTIFRVTTNGTFTHLFSFSPATGAHPSAGLAEGENGSLYGTTTDGGAKGGGTIFRFTVPRESGRP